MRIAHVVGYFMPEIGYEEYFLAKEQKKAGHEVWVVTSDRPLPHLRQEGRLESGEGAVDGIKVVRLKSLFETFFDFVISPGVRTTLNKIKPDVVHLHEPKHGFGLPAVFRKKGEYRLIMDIHDFDYPDHPLHRELKGPVDVGVVVEYLTLRRALGHFMFERADHIVAVIPACKDFLRNFYRVRGPPVTVTGLGADTEMFHFSEEGRRRVRELYDLGDDPVLLFSGVITRRKRVELLLQVFADLIEEGYDVHLMIVGKGPDDYISELKRYLKRKGVEGRVTFTGFIEKEKLKDFFSAADIGVWPFSNSINQIEAMASRLPVVVPDMQLSFIFKEGGAVVIPPGDKESLKKAVKELLMDKGLREKLGREGEEIVQKKYSYKSISERLLEIYRRE